MFIKYTRWLFGFLVSTGIVLAITPFFLSSIKMFDWDTALNCYVYSKGFEHRERDEGWAITQYYDHGISGIDLDRQTGARKLIAIFGDSQVEAHQVPDEMKVAQQVTRLWNGRHGTTLTGVGIGQSYWSVADYYQFLPAYEKLLNPLANVIVMARDGLSDFCPDEVHFMTMPRYRFNPHRVVAENKNRLIHRLAAWGLDDPFLAVWQPLRPLIEIVDTNKYRFAPGKVSMQGQKRIPFESFRFSTLGERQPPLDAWTYALDEMKAQSHGPMVLVYAPEIPRMDGGRVVMDDPQVKWVAAFKELCLEKNIGFIDMTEPFVSYFKETFSFPRGFNHGIPSIGHLNADGHRLLASAICDYFDRHFNMLNRDIKAKYAVHAN